MELLSTKSWFLGELEDDIVSTTISESGNTKNVFAVYRNPEKGTLNLALWHNGNFETRVINCTQGLYQITGETDAHPDIIRAVMQFADAHSLEPAFESANLIVSITDIPPTYGQAERLLQADIAPLPPMDEIEKGEVAVSEITWNPPTSDDTPNHRHYYTNHHICHPKNVCHYCCYSESHWLVPKHKGPLRAACTVFMWTLLMIFCFPCTCPFLVFLYFLSKVNFC